MFITSDTLDDLMHSVLTELSQRPFDIKSTRGKSSEIFGALLQLANPRARLSRTETKGKLFSALGELLWYLSGTNELDFIQYYISKYKNESQDGKTIYGGYGPRLFNLHNQHNQIVNVLKLLRGKPTSRKAVIQLFDGEDIAQSNPEIPCTCTMQFTIRNKQLYMFTTMRSNDAFIGLPHDIFGFTMFQEIMARALNVDVGIYTHAVGSLHLYETDQENVHQYLSEGFQTTKIQMPAMPLGSPWDAIETLRKAEASIRKGHELQLEVFNALDDYWLDLIRLLKIYSLSTRKDYEGIKKVQKDMKSQVYNTYIEKRLLTLQQTANQ